MSEEYEILAPPKVLRPGKYEVSYPSSVDLDELEAPTRARIYQAMRENAREVVSRLPSEGGPYQLEARQPQFDQWLFTSMGRPVYTVVVEVK